MSETSNVPAGWYSDGGRQRWWDGTQWQQFAPVPQTVIIHARPQKDMTVAYLLAIFLGGLGIHRFYLGHTGVGVTMLILSLVGWATTWLFVGFALLAALYIWLIVDLFLIPGYVREANAIRA